MISPAPARWRIIIRHDRRRHMLARRTAAGQRRHEGCGSWHEIAPSWMGSNRLGIWEETLCCDGGQIGRYRAPCRTPGTPRKTFPVRSHAATALAALVIANVALAFGPCSCGVSDVGPVAAGFWRIALAAPVLLAASMLMGGAPSGRRAGCGACSSLAGLAFAADLASWHIGIGRTTLANATLFGNSATFIFPIYGFIAARMWPSRSQALALALAAAGAGLLMARSASLSPRNLTGDLFCLFAGVLYAVYFVLMAGVRARWRRCRRWRCRRWPVDSAAADPRLVLGEQIWPGNGGRAGRAGAGQPADRAGLHDLRARPSDAARRRHRAADPADRRRAVGWIVFDERLAAADCGRRGAGRAGAGAGPRAAASRALASDAQEPKSA
jgi:hypothetical protein